MILINRTPAPSCLSDQPTIKEAQDAIDYYKTPRRQGSNRPEFTRYGVYSVQVALLEMSNNKCAYCESTISKATLDVEHYRPKNRVAGSSTPGYWWLALEWSNLLPSCQECNRNLRQHTVTAEMSREQVNEIRSRRPVLSLGKFDKFPVKNKRLAPLTYDHDLEGALLIDPTRSDPEPELKWRCDTLLSVVQPAESQFGSSEMGRETINCVALNRVDLVITRTQALETFKYQRDDIMEELVYETGSGASKIEIESIVKRAEKMIQYMHISAQPDKVFAGMMRSFILDFERKLDALLDGLG